MSNAERDGIVQQVRHAVTELDGVLERPYRDGGSGGWSFLLEDRELGHVHPDGIVHVLLPRRERDHVVAAALAAPMRSAPNSGWVEFRPSCGDDALAAAAIFRRAWRSRVRPVTVPA